MEIELIKDFVYRECQRPQNAFGLAFFEQHILVARDYGLLLADQLSADPEIITLAAYLHDIAAVQDWEAVPQHHLLGAETARGLLRQENYPPERIEQVAACIQSHSSPIQTGQGSLEEVCLSNADALAQIARPVYWLYYAFRIRNYDFEKGRLWLLQHYEKNWGILIPPARDLIAAEYQQTIDSLQQ